MNYYALVAKDYGKRLAKIRGAEPRKKDYPTIREYGVARNMREEYEQGEK